MPLHESSAQIAGETARTTEFVVSAAETPGLVFLVINDDMDEAAFWLTPERARQLAAQLVATADKVSA
jgi:hypothetical protein